MSNKFLIIDGHYLLFKSFFGVPLRLNGKGVPINAVIGFIAILKKIQTRLRPTYLLVVFDCENSLQRKEQFPEYKINRIDYSKLPSHQNPFVQLESIKTALTNLEIAWHEQKEVEADDVIASYVSKYNELHITICSSDSDFFQLLSKNVDIFKYNGIKSTEITNQWLQEKYSILPEQYILFKSIIGDKADNIEGINGIGPKKALNFINNIQTLDKENLELVKRNKQLIKFRPNLNYCMKLSLLKVSPNIESIKVGEFLKLNNLI